MSSLTTWFENITRPTSLTRKYRAGLMRRGSTPLSSWASVKAPKGIVSPSLQPSSLAASGVAAISSAAEGSGIVPASRTTLSREKYSPPMLPTKFTSSSLTAEGSARPFGPTGETAKLGELATEATRPRCSSTRLRLESAP